MSKYTVVPQGLEVARWTLFAKMQTPYLHKIMAMNAELIREAHAVADPDSSRYSSLMAEVLAAVEREQTFLVEHIRERGLSPAGVR